MVSTNFPLNSRNRVILFDTDERRYYTLDSLASLVWNLVKHPMTLVELRDAVQEYFGIEPDTAERDVLNVLREMESNGLIQTADN